MDEQPLLNYDSGSDYLLEFGELSFSFNEDDFLQRVEQAAAKLGFVEPGLDPLELQDLASLAVGGEVPEPASPLGEHINSSWRQLVGPSDRSLVHWLRRLVFRSAWLDQRVKEGDLDVVFREKTRTFGYVQKSRGADVVEFTRQPSWSHVAYRR